MNDEDGAPTPLGALRFAHLPKRRDDAAGEIALALAMRAARLTPGVYPGAVTRILFKFGGASPLEVAEIYLAQGLCDKAIAIYRKLSLLNPEKSVYFAELIGKLENNN